MRFRTWSACALGLWLVACEPAPEPTPETATEAEATTDALPEGEGTRENPYVGRGVVQELGDGELVIDHELIPGWMAPMAMAFPVTEEVALDELAVGDQVRFNVELDGPVGYQVFAIEKIE